MKRNENTIKKLRINKIMMNDDECAQCDEYEKHYSRETMNPSVIEQWQIQ